MRPFRKRRKASTNYKKIDKRFSEFSMEVRREDGLEPKNERKAKPCQ